MLFENISYFVRKIHLNEEDIKRPFEKIDFYVYKHMFE